MVINFQKKFKPPQQYFENKLISCIKNENNGLRLYNYTDLCQYSKSWDEYTLQARGIVVDEDDNVIARPFIKFFNYEEHQESLPEGTPEIIEKIDGSLIILYWYKDKWHTNTRGSFQSDQAKHAMELITSKYVKAMEILPKEQTHLFEIIYPENRIVVDYQGRDELIYLGSIETATGIEQTNVGVIQRHAKEYDSSTFKLPIQFKNENWSIESIKLLPSENREGFVLKWPNGFRLKIKFEEYKRLHRIITGCSNIAIWEMLRDRKSISEIIERVPDEFYQWVKETKKELEDQYNLIKWEMMTLLEEYDKGERFISRKEWAEYILRDNRWPAVAFAILDKKDPHDIIMKIIKPKFSRPFKNNE